LDTLEAAARPRPACAGPISIFFFLARAPRVDADLLETAAVEALVEEAVAVVVVEAEASSRGPFCEVVRPKSAISTIVEAMEALPVEQRYIAGNTHLVKLLAPFLKQSSEYK
jgi:hypothetical protein